MERNDLVYKVAQHSRSYLNIVDSNGYVAYVWIVLVIEEVLAVDINSFYGVIIKYSLTVLHVISKLAFWDKGSVQLLSGVLDRLCIFIYLCVSLK